MLFMKFDVSLIKFLACDPCEENDCSSDASCVPMSLEYKCVCNPGFIDVSRSKNLAAGRDCKASTAPVAPKRIG